jgi:hypothetical protein
MTPAPITAPCSNTSLREVVMTLLPANAFKNMDPTPPQNHVSHNRDLEFPLTIVRPTAATLLAHRNALEALARAPSTSQQLPLQPRMILHAADNIGIRESARARRVAEDGGYWRWREAPDGQAVGARVALRCVALGSLDRCYALRRGECGRRFVAERGMRLAVL